MVIASVVARLSLCFALFFLCAARVEAQVYAKCPFGWEWAQNSLKQDPCEIVSLLESQCRETLFRVPALSPPEVANYSRPSLSSPALQCECNIPVFNIIQACVECQGGNTTTWRLWTEECPSIYDKLPFPVPQDSAVPKWAFVGNLRTDFIFSDTFAIGIGRDPEVAPITVGPSIVVISSSSISSSSPPSTTVLPISTPFGGELGPTEAPGERGDDKSYGGIKVIVGISLGGTAFLVLVAALALTSLLARYRRRKYEEAHSRAMVTTHSTMQQMPQPFVYPQTTALPVTPLRPPPEPSYTSWRGNVAGSRLLTFNPPGLPTFPQIDDVFSRTGGTNIYPVYRLDGGRV